jgi:hypothetical protein
MKRNTAGQKIGAQVITAADGTAFTGSVTVYVTKDAGTQAIGSVGSGAATDEGNGYYTYAPSQSETNGDLLAYTFIGSGAIPVTVQVVPSSEVLDVVFANHNTAGTLGYVISGVLLAANFNQRTVSVTGSNHVAADIHELQPAVIQSTHFSTGAIDANALASDAVVEIRTGLGLASANLDTQLSGIQSDTNDIQSRLPAALISGRMDSNVQAIAAGVVTQIQAGLSTLTAGQVNAQVLDVLTVDLFSELAAVPGASSSLKDKIAFLFMLARNKVTQTSNTQTLFADNTTTPVAAATTSDVGGTFTRGEFA